jgi:preprotein translocase subunit SecE
VTKAVARRENFIVRYFKETRAELRKVNWPTRRQAINLTLIVLAVTAFMAALLGVIDYLFSQLFSLII